MITGEWHGERFTRDDDGVWTAEDEITAMALQDLEDFALERGQDYTPTPHGYLKDALDRIGATWHDDTVYAKVPPGAIL